MIIQGPNIQQQATGLDFSPQKGTTQTIPYEGVYSAVLAMYNTWNTPHYAALGISVSLKPANENGTAILLVTIPYGDTEIPVPTYNLVDVRNEKHILQSTIATIQAITHKDKLAIEQYFKKPEAYLDNMPALNTGASPDADTADQFATAIACWLLMKDGLKSALVFQPVLRKTYVCSKQFQIPVPSIASGAIVTTGTLIGLEQIPPDKATLMPQSFHATKNYTYTDTRVVSTTTTVTLHFNYAWMKAGYSVDDVAYNRQQVSVEYHWGLWPEFLYGQPF